MPDVATPANDVQVGNLPSTPNDLEAALSTPESVPQPAPNPQLSPELIQQMQMRELAYQQQLAQAAAQQEQYQDVMVAQQIAELPEEDRPAAIQWYQYQKAAQAQYNQLAAQYQQAVQYNQYLEQSVMPLVKDKVFSHMSQQNQIEKELLSHASTPQEAEMIVKVLSDYKKKLALQNRVEKKVDSVPTSSGQTSGSTQVPEVYNKYKGTGKISDYIKEMRKLGYW